MTYFQLKKLGLMSLFFFFDVNSRYLFDFVLFIASGCFGSHLSNAGRRCKSSIVCNIDCSFLFILSKEYVFES